MEYLQQKKPFRVLHVNQNNIYCMKKILNYITLVFLFILANLNFILSLAFALIQQNQLKLDYRPFYLERNLSIVLLIFINIFLLLYKNINLNILFLKFIKYLNLFFLFITLILYGLFLDYKNISRCKDFDYFVATGTGLEAKSIPLVRRNFIFITDVSHSEISYTTDSEKGRIKECVNFNS